jgi:hypothetical protein
MSHPRTHLPRSARIGILTAALGLTLAGGLASTASAGTANGHCPGGPYCATNVGSPSLNGNGNGKAVGKPAAGTVGKADNKNPQGQMPNGSDRNAGYECDRNHGIGRGNPAHTGCVPATPVVTPRVPPVVVPPVIVPPVSVPPVIVPPVSAPPVVAPSVNVMGVVAQTPASVPGVVAAAANPLPKAAAAGQADTSGQLALGGLAALAGLLSLGAGFGLRRRHGVA